MGKKAQVAGSVVAGFPSPAEQYLYVPCERVVNPKLNGKPVAVLSNNDGCCVAMSPEFKGFAIASRFCAEPCVGQAKR